MRETVKPKRQLTTAQLTRAARATAEPMRATAKPTLEQRYEPMRATAKTEATTDDGAADESSESNGESR